MADMAQINDPPVSLVPVPQGYAEWLAELKTRIHTAQQRAALAVNRELVLLYWQIGRDILVRQAEQGWGAKVKVIERLAHDLRVVFPEMKGFSPRNLKYMRAFAQAWPDAEFVQAVLAQLPWYHQLALLDKLPDAESRRWYAAKAIEHNWSRNVLVIPFGIGCGLCLRGAAGAAECGRRRVFHRPFVLSPEIAVLRGD